MKTFSYRGFSREGSPVTGLVEALDIKDAHERLHKRQIFAESIQDVQQNRSASRRRGRGSFGVEARSMFYRELHELVRAGLPLSQALEMLMDAPDLSTDRQLFAAIRDRVRDGKSLAEALGGLIPLSSFEKALLQAGAEAGTMEQVLSELAGFLESQKNVTDKVKTAMTYPALVLVLALFIGMFILGFLLPRVEQLLTQSRMEIPLLTKFMFGFGRWGWRIIPAVLLVAGSFWYFRRKTIRANPEAAVASARRLLRFPIVGKLLAALVKMRFCRTLALLLRGGVPLVDGLMLAGKSTGSAWVEFKMNEVSSSVRDGTSLAGALTAAPPLHEDLPGWISAGESSGNLPGMLDSAAIRYQSVWDRSLTRFLALFEPVLILLVAGFVFLVALAILLPLVQINQGLK